MHRASAVVDEDSINNYFMYKAFDVISDGSYKKLVIRSKESNDEWAITLYNKVQCVTNLIKNVVQQVNSLHEFGKDRLERVCKEVLCHVNPPCKVKTCWNACYISGIQSHECIDLTRAGKSDTVINIHRKFSHFILMLWVITKIEHMCKVFTRRWVSNLPAEQLREMTVHDMCRKFQDENRIGRALHGIFCHAYDHVMNSLENYKKVPSYET